MKLNLQQFLDRHFDHDLVWATSRWGELKGAPAAALPCPGAHKHTSPTLDDHTVLIIPPDGWPFIKCLHVSCKEEVREANRELRRALEEAVLTRELDFTLPVMSAEVRREMSERALLRERASLLKPKILAEPWEVEAIAAASPDVLEPDDDQGLALLSLFEPDDVVWIGEPNWTGRPYSAKNFRTVREWFSHAQEWPQFTCPNTFKPGSFSRSNSNVVARRFLVVESDKLSKPEQGAILRWCIGKGLHLRAVVDTMNRSLHGWFDFPEKDADQWITLLTELGCDSATMRASQPVRLAGALRQGTPHRHKLLYIDFKKPAETAAAPGGSHE